jgi:hypothetical protein
LLAQGETPETILTDYPDLEPAAILYLAMLGTDDRFPQLQQATVAVRTTSDPMSVAAVGLKEVLLISLVG